MFCRFFFGPSCSSGSVMVLSVRCLRRKPPPPGKPPILPPAKKVLYNVNHAEWMKPEDVKELLWRRHIYNCAILSLRKTFKRELEVKESRGLGIAALKRQEEEEFEVLLADNQRRNEETARKRREREIRETKELEQNVLKEIEEELNKREKLVKESTKAVLDMIERSKNFVTLENLDEKLNEALENPVVYDYAIDLQGKKIYSPVPVKYIEGTPTRQKGRIYDVTLGDDQQKQVQRG